MQLAARYNDAAGLGKSELRARIEELVLRYNGLAQFAPKIRANTVLSAEEIERQLDSVKRRRVSAPAS